MEGRLCNGPGRSVHFRGCQHGALVDHMLSFNPLGTMMLSHHYSSSTTAQINPMEKERMSV